MKDTNKTKEQLIRELTGLRQRIAEMEALVEGRAEGLKKANEKFQKDITSKVLAEKKLEEGEQRYRSVFENTGAATVIIEEDMTISMANSEFEKLSGYSKEQVEGKIKWTEFVVKEDLEKMKEFHEKRRQNGVQAPKEYEFRFVDKQGNIKHIFLNVEIIPGTRKSVASLTNITKRKRIWKALQKSEAQKKAILDASVDRIRLSDTDMRIIWANQTHTRDLNMAPEDLIGKVCYEVFVGRESPCPECPAQKVLKTGKIEHTLLSRCQEGEIEGKKYLDSYAVPIKNESGEIVNIMQVTRNITEQREAEEKLWESEERYRSLFDRLPLGVFQSTPDGRFLDANPAFMRLLGCPDLETLLSTPAITLYRDPEEREQWKRLTEKEGESFAMELEWQKLDGTPFWVRESARVVKDRRGRVLYYEGVAEDITERKHAEEALKKERDRSQQYLDVAGVMFVAIDAEQNVAMINKKGCEILGYEEHEIVGKNWFDHFIKTENIEEIKELFNQVISGIIEPFQYYEHPVLIKDGDEKIIAWHNSIIRDESERIIGTLSSGDDITERKRAEKALRESEEKYKLLVENAEDAIFIAQDETVKFPNSKTEQISGYSKKELATMRFVDLIHPEDRDMVLDRHRRRLTGEGFPNTYSFRIANRDNKELWVELNTILISWEGKPATLNFLRDITQQKKLEPQLQQAQRMEAIGTLAGGIAHDFNNILSAIMGYTEIALYNELSKDSQARRSLEQVLKASHRAKDLVKQILAFSRQSKQQRKPLEIGPIIKESLKLLRASLPSTIKIHQDIPRRSGSIMADPSQIHQVLMNLCTNAAYTMRDKGGDLGVSLCEVDLTPGDVALYPDLNSGPYLKLTVSDTGHGMDPEVMVKIFEPYFTTKPKGEGTGLGLSVVHGIVLSYGGMITAESEPGKGSTFYVFFPRAEGEATPKVEVPSPIPTGSERILIVDDEEPLVEIMEHGLKNLGYTVTARTSSTEALECFRARSEEFDLVITDQTMPSMTGDKLARELMNIRPDIPIILVTGFSEGITEQTTRQMGIREFVMKPLVIREMAQAIRRALND